MKTIEIINAEYSAKYAEITKRRMKVEQHYKAVISDLEVENAKALRNMQDLSEKALRNLKDESTKAICDLKDENAKALRKLKDMRDEELLRFADEIKQLQEEKLARLEECANS